MCVVADTCWLHGREVDRWHRTRPSNKHPDVVTLWSTITGKCNVVGKCWTAGRWGGGEVPPHLPTTGEVPPQRWRHLPTRGEAPPQGGEVGRWGGDAWGGDSHHNRDLRLNIAQLRLVPQHSRRIITRQILDPGAPLRFWMW